MRAVIVGASGVMGREMLLLSGKNDFFVCGGFDERTPVETAEDLSADVVIEFAAASATEKTLLYALRYNLPAVIGTTGHSASQLKNIARAAEKIPVFYAANFSLGMAALIPAAKSLAGFMPGAEITVIETHRRGKTDCPGGSAKLIGEALSGRAEIVSVRRGDVKGKHEIIFTLEDQTVTLSHEAVSRGAFTSGAVAAAKYLMNKKPGLYGMEDLINDN